MAKVDLLVILSAALSITGCAGQIPPSGGPVDKTPPQIIYSSPAQRELNFRSQELVIRFDKYMAERTVDDAIYFPPFTSKEISYSWSGKELTINLLSPLERDRTYILTVGARAFDTRNNSLGKAINIVFSTGSHVDTGSVGGRVYSSTPQPYTVAAFPVTEEIDTLRPALNLAKYVTQSDDSGRYIMQGLAVGKYRLICFDDQLRNFTYATQTDEYASATHDIDLTDSLENIGDIDFVPTKEDTSRPQLYSAQLAKNGTLLLKFSKPLDSASVSPENFFIRDSITSEQYPVNWAVRREENMSSVVLWMAKQLPLERTYLITALGTVADLHSNRMSTLNNTVSSELDSATTDYSHFFFNFHDSLQDVSTYDTLFCQLLSPQIFKAKSDSGVESRVSLIDSSGDDVPEGILHQSASAFEVSLKDLKSLEWYILVLRYREPESDKDSIVERHFRMVDFSTLGDIEGRVLPTGSPVVVVAARVDGRRFTTFAGGDGRFLIAGLSSGGYTLSAYVRKGTRLDYFSGTSFPFTNAEPFGFYSDPVKVRARWTSEGVRIKLE